MSLLFIFFSWYQGEYKIRWSTVGQIILIFMPSHWFIQQSLWMSYSLPHSLQSTILAPYTATWVSPVAKFILFYSWSAKQVEESFFTLPLHSHFFSPEPLTLIAFAWRGLLSSLSEFSFHFFLRSVSFTVMFNLLSVVLLSFGPVIRKLWWYFYGHKPFSSIK